jgi:uncharacterized protein YifN (PemK superfamily)
MAISFRPPSRSVVLCNFRGYELPEIVKTRPVVVLKWHKTNPLLIAVVPLSTTEPTTIEAYHYKLLQNPLTDGPKDVWAKCDMVAMVSMARLDAPRSARDPYTRRRTFAPAKVGHDQFNAIRLCVARALGLDSLFLPPAAPV